MFIKTLGLRSPPLWIEMKKTLFVGFKRDNLVMERMENSNGTWFVSKKDHWVKIWKKECTNCKITSGSGSPDF